MLAANPISPLSCKVRPPLVQLTYPAHPIDAKLDSDQENMERCFLKPCLNYCP